ncbi:unnamed protein product [Phytophthora fragariaefolia]|uniref:Unnamed protein product n=1 Tax=Phytophthora fragariaefolia TaxID=1490495 RepID=A0A9W6U688_9STRA|nr:unnamed protein product [Phytophthora fragariaefolia]
MARPLTNLLKKDAVWSWASEAHQVFEAIKSSLQSAPILALPDEDRPFSVVCDASDFAIGCALLQVDAEGCERVVSFQSRQLKAAEKNYPVHDKELLAMKYALVKFRVHLLGQKPFVIYTDHASWRTATLSPHLPSAWRGGFLSSPNYKLAHLAYLESPLYELIREVYAGDGDLAGLVEALSVPNKTVGLTARQRSRLHRYSVVEGLLYYQVDVDDEPRIVVPNDEDLRHRDLYEAHDTPLSGHLGRVKTYTSVARKFWWPHIAFIHGFHSVLREWVAAPAYAADVAVGTEFGWGEANAEDPRGLQGLRTSVKRNRLSFIETGEAVRQRVRDAMAAAQDAQKEQSDRQGRKNTQVVQLGDQVLLNAKNLLTQAVSAVGSTKLRPRFGGPFTVIGVHGHAYTLDLPSSMATHPTFYVGLLKPYHPVGAADPEGPTASPSTDGRRPPSPERTVPREPGQERESERQLEPLRGVRLASPSGPPDHTDYGSRRGASPSFGAPLRRSPRLANIGPAGGRLRHQDGISAQATPTHGLADGLSPVGHPGASPSGSPPLGRERAAPPSQSADHPAVIGRAPNQPEGSPGQDEGQSVDAVRPGRTPLPLRAPPPLLGSEGALYYHVEKLLKRRGRSGQFQYLVKWRGYPSS